ncbi:unnamed protein product [Penicillium bialowiezense]
MSHLLPNGVNHHINGAAAPEPPPPPPSPTARIQAFERLLADPTLLLRHREPDVREALILAYPLIIRRILTRFFVPADGPTGTGGYFVSERTYNEMLALTSMAVAASEAEAEDAAQDLEDLLAEAAPVLADNLAVAPAEEEAAEQ